MSCSRLAVSKGLGARFCGLQDPPPLPRSPSQRSLGWPFPSRDAFWSSKVRQGGRVGVRGVLSSPSPLWTDHREQSCNAMSLARIPLLVAFSTARRGGRHLPIAVAFLHWTTPQAYPLVSLPDCSASISSDQGTATVCDIIALCVPDGPEHQKVPEVEELSLSRSPCPKPKRVFPQP